MVIYNYNNNNNGNNNQNSGNISVSDGNKLSGGAIAGITVACTIISTVLAALGVWYARKQARNSRTTRELETAQKAEAQIGPLPQVADTRGDERPGQVELDASSPSRY